MEEVVKALLEANIRLTDKVTELALKIAEMKLTPSHTPEPLINREGSLYVTEEEQDIKYRLDAGAIDLTEYEELLKGLNFDNTSINIEH